MSEMTEYEIRADERQVFADFLELKASEYAALPDQPLQTQMMVEIYRNIAMMLRFNETAGGNDGYPISHRGEAPR